MSDYAIEIDNISKIYKLYGDNKHRLKEALHPFKKKYHKDFYALRDVSFKIKKGTTVGFIGENGSGKSTLLKILTGIIPASSGNVKVNGKISALLELGTGFNPELTGLENIYFNGTILGFTKKEMDEKRDDIIAFSEIGDFIHQPVKTYSSGMFVRLAFSVAINVDPDILIIDEALSVGDAYFSVKCINKMKEFKNSGKTILFVSHDPTAVKTLCEEAYLLDKGRVIDSGSPKDILDFYQGMILKKSHISDVPVTIKSNDSPSKEEISAFNIGTDEVELVSFKMLNRDNNEISYIESEGVLKIVFEVKALKDLDDPHFGIIIRNRLGLSVFETNTYTYGMITDSMVKNEVRQIKYTLELNLSPGDYSISIGVANKGYNKGNFKEYLLLKHDVDIIKVIENLDSYIWAGVAKLPLMIEVN